jgi:hypothetical protein
MTFLGYFNLLKRSSREWPQKMRQKRAVFRKIVVEYFTIEDVRVMTIWCTEEAEVRPVAECAVRLHSAREETRW